MIRVITRWVMGVALVGLVTWATIAVIFGAPGDTISEHVRDLSAAFPLLPFGLGVLVGHWLWPMDKADKRATLFWENRR